MPSRRKERTVEVDHDGMRERMDAIRLKQLLGTPLTERELMCLQIEQHGFGRQRPGWSRGRDAGPPA